MLITSALFAAVMVAMVGILIVWSNPVRPVNRVVFSSSLHLAAWLLFLHLALTVSEGVFWLRMACSVGASVPFHFWLMKESMANGEPGWLTDSLRRSTLWLLATCALTIVPFTQSFIPSHSTGVSRIFGWGYYGYMGLDLGLYLVLLFDGFRTIRRLTGGRRLELQVWLVGGCATTSLILMLMALNALTHDRIYIRLQPLVMLAFYAGTLLTITTHRIFDARQIILIAGEKLLLVGIVAGVAYLAELVCRPLFPAPLDWVCTIALTLWFAGTANLWLDRVFQFYPQATEARQAAFDIGRRESRIDGLDRKFTSLLKGWGQSETALVVSGTKGSLRGGGIEIEESSPILSALRHLRWASPERLARERPAPDRDELGRFLLEHQLGVIVISEGPTLSVVIGVGSPASRRPFTYPQVTQLLELASIMESALERAHSLVKAQHAEQLATVGLLGASMAHEIRNPLVTIKTFVQLLPKHYQDPVFREKFFSLIGEEVTRIDRLTEQLLDLASPRAYQSKPTELHPVLRASVELVAAKANDKRIRFLTEFSAKPDLVLTDASAAKQVLLNLCFNAIQAVEKLEGDRWVKVSTHNVGDQVEMVVEDNGPGIAPEIRPRLFEPFQSTKSSGFGLGLAICSDILVGLDATIAVDPAEPGRGATFRVQFPCPV